VGDEPPCDGCEFEPPTLHPSNEPAWRVWSICSQYGRPIDGMGGNVQPISVRDAIAICEGYGESAETFERVLLIESILYPVLSKKGDDAGPNVEDE